MFFKKSILNLDRSIEILSSFLTNAIVYDNISCSGSYKIKRIICP